MKGIVAARQRNAHGDILVYTIEGVVSDQAPVPPDVEVDERPLGGAHVLPGLPVLLALLAALGLDSVSFPGGAGHAFDLFVPPWVGSAYFEVEVERSDVVAVSPDEFEVPVEVGAEVAHDDVVAQRPVAVPVPAWDEENPGTGSFEDVVESLVPGALVHLGADAENGEAHMVEEPAYLFAALGQGVLRPGLPDGPFFVDVGCLLPRSFGEGGKHERIVEREVQAGADVPVPLSDGENGERVAHLEVKLLYGVMRVVSGQIEAAAILLVEAEKLHGELVAAGIAIAEDFGLRVEQVERVAVQAAYHVGRAEEGLFGVVARRPHAVEDGISERFDGPLSAVYDLGLESEVV